MKRKREVKILRKEIIDGGEKKRVSKTKKEEVAKERAYKLAINRRYEEKKTQKNKK